MKIILKWSVVAVAMLAVAPHRARGTGFPGPDEYLGETGGGDARATPEFYWELEVERMAKEFHSTEKYRPWDMGDVDGHREQADKNDRAAALKEGEIKPHVDPPQVQGDSDDDDAPIDENEFDDYDIGALAFHNENFGAACKAWEGLLKRPAKQRHYRSVWAAYMLGQGMIETEDYAKAVEYFELTRKLAKQGFADSLFLAADSYGWEGEAEQLGGHPEKAAPLYLTQLALGDKTAIVSLKELIPDREEQQDTEFGPWEMKDWSAERKKEYEAKALAGLKFAATDPLLRRLVTAHMLATGTVSWIRDDDKVGKRSAGWLAIVDAAKPGKVKDAEYLGWLAYSTGDYKAAAHWLALADAATPASCWLRAKLDLRDGKIDDAAKSMEKAWGLIGDGDRYSGVDAGKYDAWDKENNQDFDSEHGVFFFAQSAAGDLGLARLSRADFTQALDTFRKGGLWPDAAYVAERVLTVDELKVYVDHQPAKAEEAPVHRMMREAVEGYDLDENDVPQLRDMLGRRLVREGRYEEATGYLSNPYREILAKYTQALKDGANTKLPDEQRAKAWFTAAWIARNDGMELMGTEVAPDGYFFEGDRREENSNIASMRRNQKYPAPEPGEDLSKLKLTSFDIAVSKQEQARLAKSDVVPEQRFHYRTVAATLAMRAAALLKDNTPELADVVDMAGKWTEGPSQEPLDEYYNVIHTRCPDTEIGRKVQELHAFVDIAGPWSREQVAAHVAMLGKLGLKPGFDDDSKEP